MRVGSGWILQYVTVLGPGQWPGERSTRSRNLPRGCEFWRSCKTCPFEDCRAGDEILGYNSRDGQAQRAKTFALQLSRGVPAAELEQLYRLAPGQAIIQAALVDPSFHLRADRLIAKKRRAIQLRRQGVTEGQVASQLSVTARVVRKWTSGLDGIKRHAGWENRARRAL